MHWPMHLASRCRAKSKRSGLKCRAAAVRGYAVCRMHGAGGAAPRGNRNAWKHGAHSAEALALKSKPAPEAPPPAKADKRARRAQT
jgi:hypothetical protein